MAITNFDIPVTPFGSVLSQGIPDTLMAI